MGKMFVKLAALVLVGLGVWAAVGYVGSAIGHKWAEEAFKAGTYPVTYGYCVWGAMAVVGLMVIGKVKG